MRELQFLTPRQASTLYAACRGKNVPRNEYVARFAAFVSLLLIAWGAAAQSIAFINPGKSDEIYWATASQAMQSTAESLGAGGIRTFLAYSSIAAEQSEWLFERHPHARLVWAGNDLMAFGAMQSWEKRGGKPGVDAWFSGINTSREALDAIKTGRLTALAGGHFITGAWSIVMLYDYHHGRDFADEGLELERSMFTAFDSQLADRYIERFGRGFSGVDFRRYSKTLNPKLKRYNFSFAQLLEPRR